jgi:hypothetical protein
MPTKLPEMLLILILNKTCLLSLKNTEKSHLLEKLPEKFVQKEKKKQLKQALN